MVVEIPPSTTDLKAANGSPIPLLVEKTVKAVWKGRTIKLHGIRDRAHGRSDPRSHVATGAGRSLGFQDRPPDNRRRDTLTVRWRGCHDMPRLVVQETIVIPARSQMDIPIKTVYSNLKATRDAAGTGWMTESGETAHGLQITRTLIAIRVLEVPVRVMNVLHHPVTWEKGAMVSSLEQMVVMTPTTEETRPAPDLTFKVDLLDAVDEEIQPAEKEAVSQLLDEFEDVFERGEYDLGSTDIVEHTIDTGDYKPIRQPLRRNPLPNLQAITEQTSEMLRQVLIEPAISEWT